MARSKTFNTNSQLDKVVSAGTIKRYVWLVNPTRYKEWATPPADVGFLKLSEAIQFIPPILKLLQLKRISVSKISGVPNRGEYRIGSEVPTVRWMTVGLQINRQELKRYAYLISTPPALPT